MSEYRSLSNKMIITIALVGFITLLVLWFALGVFQSSNNKYELSLDDGWDVYVNDTQLYEDADLLSVNFGQLSVGDQVDLYVDLPDSLNGGYTVEILVYLCSLDAYVDDSLIYSYGDELIGKDVMVGSGYHFINLPDDITGKTLHISMIMNEDNAFTSISTPKCALSKNAYVAFAKSQIIGTVIGIFLIALGVILFVVSLVACFYNKIYVRLLYIGLFSFFMGGWTVFSNKAWQLFSMSRVFNTNLEYMTLYFAPVPFALLMYEMRREDKTWRRSLVHGITVLLFTFAALVTVLHFTNVVRYPKVLTYFHVVAFSSIIIIIFAGYISVKKKTNSETLTAIATLILLGVLGLDIGRFNLQKYILPNYDILMNSFIPLGTLVFVIMLIVSYLLYMYDMVMSKTEKDTLTKLAYHDVLTGLYNRTKYEQTMSELDEKKEDFAIISIDLNDLKYVNDTFGHNKGDAMLTTFASILRHNFEGIGKCFRTGGDEYIVVVDGNRINEITQAIVDMTEDEERESKNFIFEIHASYGIAYRSEIEDGQAFKVFRLADRRMYEMKSESKGKEYVFGTEGAKA